MPEYVLHRPGYNCWRIEQADSASVIVDCANYYRLLHEAICKATRSVYILGWDIDSRIELLRGPEAQQSAAPSRLFDLVKWKSQQNPDIEFYFNRWDYTLYQAAEREGFSLLRWRFFSPDNVHFHLDNTHPIGGCHHQKIVVIDDELAFIGGMDVAIGRWDYRSHHPRNAYRVDPGGTYQPRTRHAFPPHHDIMMMVAGPAAQALGHLARERWCMATGTQLFEALPKNRGEPHRLWPHSVTPDFTGIPIAIARTMPCFRDEDGIYEVEQLYIDQIAQAEHFIYIENQYFTSPEIAQALNRQLLTKPDLRVLLVSCCEPQGIMERKAMWGGRVLFHDALVKDDVGDRVLMTYPISRENGREENIRIHSKLMAVDDRFLHVGSANLNNRSLRLDTECDLSIAGHTQEMQQKIAAIRNDMIREHTGLPYENIQRIVAGEDALEKFVVYHSESRQHLCKIDDEKYRHQSFIKWAIRLADPKEPFFRQKRKSSDAAAKEHKTNHAVTAALLMAAILGFALIWKVTPLSHYVSPSHIAPYLRHIQHNVWTFPAVIMIYVMATLVFFPLTILILATAIAFPPYQALPLAFGGMLCSACCGYVFGRMAGIRFLHFFVGRAAEKISQYTKNGGVVAVTLLRMVPIAPLGVVDFGLGSARVPFLTYITGTILGLLPGIVAFTFLGNSLDRLWRNLNRESVIYVVASLVGWISVVVLSHVFVKKWRQKQRTSGNA